MFRFPLLFSFGNISSSSRIFSSGVPPPGTARSSGLVPSNIDEGFSPLPRVRTPLTSLVKSLGAHYLKLPKLVGLELLDYVPSERNIYYLSSFVLYEEAVFIFQTFGRIFSRCIRFLLRIFVFSVVSSGIIHLALVCFSKLL